MADAATSSADGGSKVALLLTLVHTVAVLAVLGLFVYTRVLFQRPVYTETTERELLPAKLAPKTSDAPGLIPFEPLTVNIGAKSVPNPVPGAQPASGRQHVARVAFALEVRDMSRQDQIEALRPVLIDKVLSILGQKTMQELTTVQGRYIVRTQVIDLVNQMLKQSSPQEDLVVTNIYFTEFMVQ